MKDGDDGLNRADRINPKALYNQLERHLNKVLMLERNSENRANHQFSAAPVPTLPHLRREWEIDPSKLIIKSVIARGTFDIIYRGIYDSQYAAVKLLDSGEEGQRLEAEIASLRSSFQQEVVV